ncbi:hypothetical protein SLEP1_g57117 [Rubroshorea leprosula]|uniref:Uncharacterized protein n=1 Tax=Rubroshorea leprosula TaxID=152421 RepID=A0AAV5MMP6_9ROSI|nr:hypothetical protein SLEP1_g57117 [Rubroshorea leprosula]
MNQLNQTLVGVVKTQMIGTEVNLAEKKGLNFIHPQLLVRSLIM